MVISACKYLIDHQSCYLSFSCKKGYFDDSPNPGEPGRVCAVYNEGFKATSSLLTQSKVDEVQCGKDVCFFSLNEVCVDGSHCECRPGATRQTVKDRCEHVQRTPLSIRVISKADQILRYSSQYNNPTNVPYIEFAADFKKEMAEVFKTTVYAPKQFVTSDVSAITHPKTVNNTWSEGLLVNFTVATKQSEYVDFPTSETDYLMGLEPWLISASSGMSSSNPPFHSETDWGRTVN